MKKTNILFGAGITILLSLTALVGCGKKRGEDIYEGDRLVLDLKNLYFDTWQGEDMYTEMINEKFGVSIKASNYDYNDWDGMVNTAVNGDNLTDVIHFNLKAYNYGSTYERWVGYKIIKPLPEDMSKWPNLQNMISKVSNIDALKIDGKLYGIPIMNDIVNTEKDFSNFTYVYRRDWAKKIDEMNPGKEPVYKEGDVYTWEEFNRLAKALSANLKTLSETDKASVLVDESWGFPSITNFYKDVPHCYAKDENGKAINAFTSDKYIAGLEAAKQFVSDKIYSQDQFNFAANKANELYLGDQAAILYDNYSLTNYIKLRKGFKKLHKNLKAEEIEDGTALLKIKGPDDKYAIEGTENWFSMTMFNYDISDKKMEKVLDILDYLLSDEGTMLALYGKEDYDYYVVNDDDYDYEYNGKKIKLTSDGWEKGEDGVYVPKTNGAKYLRYMATLGNETKPYDPFTDMEAFNILNAWQKEMQAAKNAGSLRVVKEPADIDWMSTETKNDKTESILADANNYALKYCFGKIADIDAYKAEFDKDVSWKRVLDEINAKLGK